MALALHCLSYARRHRAKILMLTWTALSGGVAAQASRQARANRPVQRAPTPPMGMERLPTFHT